jgi:hypothetical protein
MAVAKMSVSQTRTGPDPAPFPLRCRSVSALLARSPLVIESVLRGEPPSVLGYTGCSEKVCKIVSECRRSGRLGPDGDHPAAVPGARRLSQEIPVTNDVSADLTAGRGSFHADGGTTEGG